MVMAATGYLDGVLDLIKDVIPDECIGNQMRVQLQGKGKHQEWSRTLVNTSAIGVTLAQAALQ
jgi:hypothetical protein